MTAMTVERVRTTHGSHITPSLEPHWSKAKKLEWAAAVASADTGLVIKVLPANCVVRLGPFRIRQRGLYDVMTTGTSTGPFRFGAAWDFIQGVVAGARATSTG